MEQASSYSSSFSCCYLVELWDKWWPLCHQAYKEVLLYIFLIPHSICIVRCCFIQSFHWSCSPNILWHDHTIPLDDWFLEITAESAKSLYSYSCGHASGFDGATVSISSIVDSMPCNILLVVLLSNANPMNSPCSMLLRIKLGPRFCKRVRRIYWQSHEQLGLPILPICCRRISSSIR